MRNAAIIRFRVPSASCAETILCNGPRDPPDACRVRRHEPRIHATQSRVHLPLSRVRHDAPRVHLLCRGRIVLNRGFMPPGRGCMDLCAGCGRYEAVKSTLRSSSISTCPRMNGTRARRGATRTGTSTPASTAGTMSPKWLALRLVDRKATPPPTTITAATRSARPVGAKPATALTVESRWTAVHCESLTACRPVSAAPRLTSTPSTQRSSRRPAAPTAIPGNAVPPNGPHKYGQSLFPSGCVEKSSPADT